VLMEMSHRPWQSHHTEAQTKGPKDDDSSPNGTLWIRRPTANVERTLLQRRLRSLCSNSSWTELVHPIACRISAR